MRDQCTYFSHSSGSLQAQAIKTGTTTTTAWLHILPAYRSTDPAPAPAPIPVVAAVPLRVVLVVVAVPFKKGARSTKEKVAAVSLFAWQQQQRQEQRRRRRQQQRRQQQLASGAGVAVRHLPHADRWQPL